MNYKKSRLPEEIMEKFVTIDRSEKMSAILKVVGVGGGGCNAIESMIKRGLTGVEYVAVNTDAQVLEGNNAQKKVQVGVKITKGLGAGADPNVGRKAVEEDKEKLTEILSGSDMVFVTSGMGGGTGTGSAPVVASIAKSLGALVVGVVTKPFRWEGKMRMKNAEEGILELKKYVDSLIVIPNERLLSIVDPKASFKIAFDKPNEVLYEATRGIADIITIQGLINVDFADVRTVMNQSGVAMMGTGMANGENRVIEAAQKAISSPLLDGVNIKGAKNILLNVTGSSDMSIQEVIEGNSIIYDAAGDEANVIFGCVQKEDMKDYVSYTVIATGFDSFKKGYESTPKPEVKKEGERIFPARKITSGFIASKGIDDLRGEDLATPTIFRVIDAAKKNEAEKDKKSLEDTLNAGYKSDKVRNFNEDESNRAKVNSHYDDEEDSSSFLRMIMD